MSEQAVCEKNIGKMLYLTANAVNFVVFSDNQW